MILYKYVKEDGIDLLQSKRLLFKQPFNLNDPFEFLPKILDRVSEVDEHLERNRVKREAGQHVGIASFSYNFDSLLMWSHYTDGHQGFVIGIDTDKIFRNQENKIIEVFKARYTQKRAERPKSKADYTLEKLLDMILAKSVDWAYEDEYRILFQTKHYKKENDCFYQEIDPDGIIEVILGCNSSNNLLKKAVPEFDEYKLRFVAVTKAIKGKARGKA